MSSDGGKVPSNEGKKEDLFASVLGTKSLDEGKKEDKSSKLGSYYGSRKSLSSEPDLGHINKLYLEHEYDEIETQISDYILGFPEESRFESIRNFMNELIPMMDDSMFKLAYNIKRPMIHEMILNGWGPEVADAFKPIIIFSFLSAFSSLQQEERSESVMKHMNLNSFYRSLFFAKLHNRTEIFDLKITVHLQRMYRNSNDFDEVIAEKMMFFSAKTPMIELFKSFYTRGTRLSQESEDILNSIKYSGKTKEMMTDYYSYLKIDPPFKVYVWYGNNENDPVAGEYDPVDNEYDPVDPFDPVDNVHDFVDRVCYQLVGGFVPRNFADPNYGGAQMQDHGGAQDPDKIKNPETNRMINVGGSTYKKLIKKGYEHIGDRLIKR